MRTTLLKSAIDPGHSEEPPTLSLRSVARKSALLNAAIVLTSFPVLVFAGGPRAVVPALVIMAGVSFVVWAATYTVFSFVSLARIYRILASSETRRTSARPRTQSGVSDRWLDGPF
jgi:hypothetical protein